MDEVIKTHIQFLADAVGACRSLPDQISMFATAVSTLPQAMVKLRLTWVQTAVMFGELYLRLQHGEKGFIFVQAGHGMLSIKWEELDLLEGRKVSTGSSGGVFLSPEMVSDKVEELLRQVDRGELAPAVHWLSRYSQVNIDGLDQLDWHANHERKETDKLNVIAKVNASNVPIHGESPVYLVSLIGRRPESIGNLQHPSNEFSRFLVSTRAFFHRLLTKPLIRIRPLVLRIINLLKGITP
jgi:hypothetical protein